MKTQKKSNKKPDKKSLKETEVQQTVSESIDEGSPVPGVSGISAAPQPGESPKAEEPKAEELKAEEPKAEEPKAEEPKAEEPKAEEPKAEEPKAEEPKAEEPKAEEPKAEEPKAEEPVDPAVRIATTDDVCNAIESALVEPLPSGGSVRTEDLLDIVNCIDACHLTMLQLGRLVNSMFTRSRILPWEPYDLQYSKERLPGRILSYSAAVTREILRLTECCGARWSRPESPYLVGMLHLSLAGHRLDQIQRRLTRERAAIVWRDLDLTAKHVGGTTFCWWDCTRGWETVAWIGARFCKALNEDEIYAISSAYSPGIPYDAVDAGNLVHASLTQTAVQNVWRGCR